MTFHPGAAVMAATHTAPPSMPMPAIDMQPDDAAPLPDMPLPPLADIESAALALAGAHAAVEESRAGLAAAQAHHDLIAERIEALEAERAGIISRRAAGDEEPDDGARLALINADIEGLRGLLTTAEAALVEPRRAAEAARAAVGNATFALRRAEDEAAEQALVAHADRLGALLLATVHELEVFRQRRGRALPPWAPSSELHHALRKLAIQRRVV